MPPADSGSVSGAAPRSTDAPRPLAWWSLVVGGSLAALGIAVLIGWYTGVQTLTRVRPEFASMKYNTALGFLLLGVSNLGWATGRPRMAFAAAALVGLMALATLVEYAAGVRLGLDTIFWKTDDPAGPALAFPGRMGPNTAVGFALSALALAWGARWFRRIDPVVVACLGAAVLALATVSMVGYATGLHRAHTWGLWNAMAFHTSIALAAQGALLTAVGSSWAAAAGQGRRWMLLPTGIALGLCAVLFGLALAARNEETTQRAIDDAGRAARVEIRGRLESHVSGLFRMAERWERRASTPEVEWSADAQSYLRDFADYRTLIFLDASLAPRWRQPRDAPVPAGLSALSAEAGRPPRPGGERPGRLIMAQAPRSAGQELLIFVPVFRGGRLEGAILGAVNLERLFAAALPPEIMDGPAVRVTAGGATVYARNAARGSARPARSLELETRGLTLQVTLEATPALESRQRSPLGAVALGAWTLLTVLTLLALHLAETARARAAELVGQRQRLRAQTAELERSNVELEQFAYAASHDLKSPLRAISNLAYWLESDLGPHMSTESRQQMILLQGRVRRLERLLGDMLRYSQAAKSTPVVERVDVGALVRTVFRSCERPPDFALAVATEMPVLLTSRALLEQVLASLVGNAIKHHPGGAGTVSVECRQRGAFQELVVSDDGAGIDQRHGVKIFQPFQTLRSRDAVEGSGIGLALAQRLVEAAGGSISLEPHQGRGARFRFSWPTVWPERLGLSAAPPAAMALRSA
jgi:signal transduction histidine kinase